MEPAGQGDRSAERAYLGVEIGELAAWVTVTYGRSGVEARWRASFMTPPSPDAFLARLVEDVRDRTSGGAIEGIGVACWAPVESERGVITPRRATPDMPEWTEFPLAARLSELLGAPSRLAPAVNAAALAEAALGAGKDTSSMVYIHLGREVLCSVVYNGAPQASVYGRVGQIGHWRVVEDGPRCACGAIGHLNPLCSSQGIVRLAIGLASQDESALAQVNRVTAGRAESLTASGVVALASAGVEPLLGLVSRAADALGLALAQLALIAHPALIVLGGPLGVAGGFFLERTRERLTEELLAIPAIEAAPRLAPAALEPHSALIGAWLLGRRPASV